MIAPREVWVVLNAAGRATSVAESENVANRWSETPGCGPVHRYVLAKPKREVLAYVVRRERGDRLEYVSSLGMWKDRVLAMRFAPNDRVAAGISASARGGTVVALVRKAAP